jgi:hypothetical protein
MKFVSHVALVLSVLLIAATVDSVPDPPAVTPHVVNLKTCVPEFVGAFREPRLLCAFDTISSHVSMQRVSLLNAPKPDRSRVWVLSGYATDPSPPVL